MDTHTPYLKVIDIIHKVFVVTDIRLGQSGPTKLNPSLKSIKKLKKLAEELRKNTIILKKRTGIYHKERV